MPLTSIPEAQTTSKQPVFLQSPQHFQNTKSVKYNFCFLKKSTELKSELRNNFLVSDPEEISKKKKIRIIRR